MAMTNMKRADGATPNLLFRIPRFAEMSAKGMRSFSMSKAPCEKGSKIGIRRYTLSRLNEDTDATFPVLKKADWRSVRKKRETRASDKVSDLKGEDDSAAGTTGVPFV
jgi:hypothetical protein